MALGREDLGWTAGLITFCTSPDKSAGNSLIIVGIRLPGRLTAMILPKIPPNYAKVAEKMRYYVAYAIR
jgi:hypothetical protein